MKLRLLLCSALLFTGLAVRAEEAAIGFVKTASGQATVGTGTGQVAAQPGTPVYLGSRLRTGPDGSLGIAFRDDTLMAFGPDTELTVDEYLYAPSQGLLRLAASLLRGSLNYVSGVIAKLQPDAVSVRTPSGIIGVRGTQFVAKVDPAAP